MLIEDTKKYKYYTKVTYNNNEYNIENTIIVKYGISTGKRFNINLFNEILKENEFYYYDRIALNKLKRMLTKHELKQFLIEKEASLKIIDKLILKYEKYNYINDLEYTKLFIERRINKEGPKRILDKLVKKGVSKEIINKELSKINEELVIKNYINKKIPKIKNKTKVQTLNQIKRELVNKGYNYNLSISLSNTLINNFKFNEDELISKEFHKIYNRHKNKKEGMEFKYFIKQSLYRKGFEKDLIENIINTNNDLF